MSRTHKVLMLAGVSLPFAAVGVAIVVFWNHGVSLRDLLIMGTMYVVGQLGITIGYHRMLTHRSFETSTPVKVFWATAGSFAMQGTPTDWVADHRQHHAYTDVEGDPHSPHLHGEDWRGMLRGMFHAHLGWLFETVTLADKQRFAPDLVDDRWVARVGRAYGLIFLLTFLVPAALGFAFGGTVEAALTALLWGGFIRVFCHHHFTFSINSICHVFGSRRFAIEETDKATNVPWLAIPSMGESWHHNHHAFPRSAYHGLKWYEIDPSEYVIRAMERLGLIWNVVTIPESRQEEKLLRNGAVRPPARHRPPLDTAEPVAAES